MITVNRWIEKSSLAWPSVRRRPDGLLPRTLKPTAPGSYPPDRCRQTRQTLTVLKVLDQVGELTRLAYRANLDLDRANEAILDRAGYSASQREEARTQQPGHLVLSPEMPGVVTLPSDMGGFNDCCKRPEARSFVWNFRIDCYVRVLLYKRFYGKICDFLPSRRWTSKDPPC